MKEKLLNISLWIFWAIGFFIITAILYLLSIKSYNIILSLSPIGILLASFIATLSVMKSIMHNDQHKLNESIKQESEFYMNEASNGLDSIYILLKDKNNQNIIWKYASDTINLVLELEQKIQNESHKKAYQLKKTLLQIKLKKILSQGDYSISLPVSFFYGIKNWNDKGMTPRKAYEETYIAGLIIGVPKAFDINETPYSTNIAISNIITIYSFLTDENIGRIIDEFNEIKDNTPIQLNDEISEGAIKYAVHLLHTQDFPNEFKSKTRPPETLTFNII